MSIIYLLLLHSAPQHLGQSHKLEPENKVETTGVAILLRQAQHCAIHQHSRSSVVVRVRWPSNAQCTGLRRHQDRQPWKTCQTHSHALALCKQAKQPTNSVIIFVPDKVQFSYNTFTNEAAVPDSWDGMSKFMENSTDCQCDKVIQHLTPWNIHSWHL